MGDGSAALWFGAGGLEVLDVVDDSGELVVSVQTTATVVGCLGLWEPGKTEGSAGG